MPRYIEVYNKSNEMLLRDEILPEIPIEEIKKIFDYDEIDPNYFYAYEIDAAQAKTLAKYTKIEFDFERYDYFFAFRKVD